MSNADDELDDELDDPRRLAAVIFGDDPGPDVADDPDDDSPRALARRIRAAARRPYRTR